MAGVMEPEVRYVTTSDGVRIAYTVTGSGPPHVLSPGLMTSHVQLEWSHPVMSQLLGEFARYSTLIRFDPRGSGLSDRVLPEALDDYVRDMEAVVKRTNLNEFALTGLQLSAPAAISFAACHPEQVSRLVLVDGFARNKDLLTTPQAQALIAAARVDWVLATEAIGFASFGSGREESMVQGQYIRSCVGPEIFAKAELFATWDASELARSITAPTLILKHNGIQFVTLEMVKDLAACIPTAQLMLVEGSWADDPVGVARRIVGFINAESPGSLVAREDAASRLPGPSSRLVTILFTDLVGHTQMMSRLGDQRGREVLREHDRITREVLKAHGGTEVKTMGDGFMASFGSVTKAVECAVALQRAFAEREGEPLNVRVGLNAGEPIEEDGDLFGATVILASRIAAKAEGGEILVADTVRGLCSGKGFLFADRGEFVAKGFEEPVRVYEVRWQKDLQQFELKPA